MNIRRILCLCLSAAVLQTSLPVFAADRSDGGGDESHPVKVQKKLEVIREAQAKIDDLLMRVDKAEKVSSDGKFYYKINFAGGVLAGVAASFTFAFGAIILPYGGVSTKGKVIIGTLFGTLVVGTVLAGILADHYDGIVRASEAGRDSLRQQIQSLKDQIIGMGAAYEEMSRAN